jgi:DNA invertase Pin-like site-specific DNA recombinase
MQSVELREYCTRRGLQIVGEFSDVMSGSKDSRPELAKALALCKQRRTDYLLVWKLDRLGRSLRHLVNTIADLEAVGVGFVSLRDNLDFSTPAGRLMFAVIGAMAQFERDLIRERTKAGIAQARRKGKAIGRPRVAVNASTIASLRAEGASWNAIVKKTGVSMGTAQRAVASLPKKVSGNVGIIPTESMATSIM